jgi:hypothetical protein
MDIAARAPDLLLRRDESRRGAPKDGQGGGAMTRPLIHIGLHKTGTTFLQANVFSAPGSCFRQVWSFGEIAERIILPHPMRFDPAAQRADFDRAFDRAFDGRGVPVVSHEALSGVPSAGRYHGFEVAGRIHAIFPDARILIGVREQRSMIRSLYDEYVVRGGVDTAEDFLGVGLIRTGFRPLCRLDHFEYDLIWRRYAELFGPENVLVAPLERLGLDQSAYLARLCAFSGVPDMTLADLPRRNVGRGALTMEIERRLNHVIRFKRGRFEGYGAYPWPIRARNRFLRLFQRAIPARFHARRERKLRALIAEIVGDSFAPSNRRLAEATGLDLADLGYST